MAKNHENSEMYCHYVDPIFSVYMKPNWNSNGDCIVIMMQCNYILYFFSHIDARTNILVHDLYLKCYSERTC